VRQLQAFAFLGLEAVEELIEEADINGDGCIDYKEFSDLMRRR
jgi:Ca2+-binding EF-hand superfamily protein